MTAIARRQNRFKPVLILLLGLLLVMALLRMVSTGQDASDSSDIIRQVDALRRQWHAWGKPGLKALGDAPGKLDREHGQAILDFLDKEVQLEAALREADLSEEEIQAIKAFRDELHAARGPVFGSDSSSKTED